MIKRGLGYSEGEQVGEAKSFGNFCPCEMVFGGKKASHISCCLTLKVPFNMLFPEAKHTKTLP